MHFISANGRSRIGIDHNKFGLAVNFTYRQSAVWHFGIGPQRFLVILGLRCLADAVN